MELDDIKKQLEQLDGTLHAAVRLNRRVLDQSILDKADKALGRLGWALGQVFFCLVQAQNFDCGRVRRGIKRSTP